MNPPAPPLIKRRPARRLWPWALLLVPLLAMLCLMLLVGAVASCFRVESEARVLHTELIRSSGVQWRQNIAVNASWLLLDVVRCGLSSVKLEPGPRAALQSVRSATVGVYQLESHSPQPDRPAMLAAADSSMLARGWQRAVGVLEGRNMVAVYLPGKNVSMQRLKCCVMVFDGEQMVLVSARGNLEPILNYALKQRGLNEPARWLAQN